MPLFHSPKEVHISVQYQQIVVSCILSRVHHHDVPLYMILTMILAPLLIHREYPARAAHPSFPHQRVFHYFQCASWKVRHLVRLYKEYVSLSHGTIYYICRILQCSRDPNSCFILLIATTNPLVREYDILNLTGETLHSLLFCICRSRR